MQNLNNVKTNSTSIKSEKIESKSKKEGKLKGRKVEQKVGKFAKCCFALSIILGFGLLVIGGTAIMTGGMIVFVASTGTVVPILTIPSIAIGLGVGGAVSGLVGLITLVVTLVVTAALLPPVDPSKIRRSSSSNSGKLPYWADDVARYNDQLADQRQSDANAYGYP